MGQWSLVWGGFLGSGKHPLEQPVTSIQISGVHRTAGGGPLVWGVVPWLGVVPRSGEGSSRQESAPPPPEHAVTPIRTPGVRRTVGGGPLVWGGAVLGAGEPAPRPQVLTERDLPPQVQAQLQLEGVAHAHPHLHPHLAAHAPYLMFPPPPFGLPIASLAESASAAAVVAAAAKSNSKNSSIADLRLKARKHAEALGL